MAKDYIIKSLREQFQGRQRFSKEELWSFFRRFDPDLKETTFRWRIYDLKAKKIVQSVSKSEYTLNSKPSYEPILDNQMVDMAIKMRKNYPYLHFSIWSTKWLNEFMLHQPGRFLYIVEVESEAVESVFFHFKDNGLNNVFLDPSLAEIERYVSDATDPFIIKSLITKSPTRQIKETSVPTLEKILVDIFSDKVLFNPYQGSELVFIFNQAYDKYALNFTKLFGYARRRGKEDELIKFLNEKTNVSKELLHDR
jgi:hypothetical protein